MRGALFCGAADFSTARIDGGLDFRGSRFDCGASSKADGDETKKKGSHRRRKEHSDAVAIKLSGASIAGDLRLSELEAIKGAIDLRQARTRVLVDDTKYWGDRNVRYLLDGFTYERFGDDPFGGTGRAVISARERLRWLMSQPRSETSGIHFKPQPFTQLAQTLSEMGHVGEAKRIMFQRDKRIAANQNRAFPSDWWLVFPLIGWFFTVFFNFLIGLTLGFGHLPQRAAITIVACLALGVALFGTAYRDGILVAKSAPQPTPFRPLIYSADVFFPVLNLGRREVGGRWTGGGPCSRQHPDPDNYCASWPARDRRPLQRRGDAGHGHWPSVLPRCFRLAFLDADRRRRGRASRQTALRIVSSDLRRVRAFAVDSDGEEGFGRFRAAQRLAHALVAQQS